MIQLKWIRIGNGMKKIHIFGIFIAIILVLLLVNKTYSDVLYAKGDVNGDKIVDITDAKLIAKYIINKTNADEIDLDEADVNGDGSIKMNDVMLIATGKAAIKTDLIEGYFLDTQMSNSTDEAIIFKTYDDKLILIDTGYDYDYNIILSKLKDLSKTSTITIDYLIISHGHGDHYGSLSQLLDHVKDIGMEDDDFPGDTEIIINNFIYKEISLPSELKEKIHAKIENRINLKDYFYTKRLDIDDALEKAKEYIKGGYDDENEKFTGQLNDDELLYPSFNYQTGENSSVYTINSNIDMILFNVYDVYAAIAAKLGIERSKLCSTTTIYGTSDNGVNTLRRNTFYRFRTSTISFEGTKFFTTEANENTNAITTTPTNSTSEDFTTYFLDDGMCNENANSIAVLFKIKTGNSNKYIYVPSDLQNNGYTVAFDGYNDAITNWYSYRNSDDTSLKYEENIPKISSESYITEFTMNVTAATKKKIYKNTEELVFPVRVKAETKTAEAIANYIINENHDSLNDLVIYQQAHHGRNNAPSAINALNLNNGEVTKYSIGVSPYDSETAAHSFDYRTQVYTLSNTQKMYTGKKYPIDEAYCNGGGGVICTINSYGEYECHYVYSNFDEYKTVYRDGVCTLDPYDDEPK
jgi:hypothetical protein